MDLHDFTVANLKGTSNRLQEFKWGQVTYIIKEKKGS